MKLKSPNEVHNILFNYTIMYFCITKNKKPEL